MPMSEKENQLLQELQELENVSSKHYLEWKYAQALNESLSKEVTHYKTLNAKLHNKYVNEKHKRNIAQAKYDELRNPQPANWSTV